ncbi:MAG: RsmG family class I SAM-dependent methyltransferase [Nitrospinota bacterium]
MTKDFINDFDNDFNESIGLFLDELYRWNEKMSLTSVKREKADEVLIKPSIEMAGSLEGMDNADVFDVGSGGGIPGIVMALGQPANSFKLVESNMKKAVFLSHIISELGLGNALVINKHTDEMIKGESFMHVADFVTSRAVNRARVFKAAAHFLKPGGRLFIHRSEKEKETDKSLRLSFKLIEKNEHVECYGIL